MICGTVASKPTTSSIPPSFGSAMVNPLLTMPKTISLAAMPVRSDAAQPHTVGVAL
jgi:hypothetical protein